MTLRVHYRCNSTCALVIVNYNRNRLRVLISHKQYNDHLNDFWLCSSIFQMHAFSPHFQREVAIMKIFEHKNSCMFAAIHSQPSPDQPT